MGIALTKKKPATTLQLLCDDAKRRMQVCGQQIKQLEQILERVQGTNRVVHPDVLSNEELTARINLRMARGKYIELAHHWHTLKRKSELQK